MCAPADVRADANDAAHLLPGVEARRREREVVVQDVDAKPLPARVSAAGRAHGEHVHSVRDLGRVPAPAAGEGERPTRVPPDDLAVDQEVDVAHGALDAHAPRDDARQRLVALDGRRVDVQGVALGEREAPDEVHVVDPPPVRPGVGMVVGAAEEARVLRIGHL